MTDLIKILLIVIPSALLTASALYVFRVTLISRGHWHHSFVNFDFSPQQLYALAESAIKKHEIPGISFSRVAHFEASIIGGRREYLRVSREDYVFDICASPFGTGFFVSWWFVEQEGFLKRQAKKNMLFALFNLETYYQIDTATMYKEYIHKGLLEAIDEMTNDKGIRALSDVERQTADIRG